MAWRRRFRSVARPLLAGLLFAGIVASTAAAQKLPPAVAAAATPISDGQALVKQGKFTDALAKFGEAQGATAGISQPTLRLFYQVTARLGSATALDGMQRYDAALDQADWADQTVATPPARQLPNALKAAVHHMRGVILYHLQRIDDAKAMFDQAAREGDKTAADWQKAVNTPTISTRPADLVARADEAAQDGRLREAQLLYMIALQHYDALGDKTYAVMERALAVAARMAEPPLIPEGSDERLRAADAALQDGSPAKLENARDLLVQSVIVVPWWGDGWKRLADVEEKLGNPSAARDALRYYLKAAPKANDRDAIEQRIANLGQSIGSGNSVAAATAPPSSPPGSVPDISGNWSTTDGRIIAVKQNGNQVSWSSCCRPGHEDLVVNVSGTFDGRTLVGTYHYREGQAEGYGSATYTLAGDRLEGFWQAPDGKTFHSALIRHQDTATDTLAGTWTTVSGHTVTLRQNGNQVSWTTCCRQSHPAWVADISAMFDGKNLVGTYHWRDGAQQGNGTVSYVLSGNQLEGTLERPGKEPYHSVLTRQVSPGERLTGAWTLDDGRTVQIKQTGNQVGWDVHGGAGHESRVGTVTGTFDGKELVGVYEFTEGSVRSRGTVHLTLDGSRLVGTLASLEPPGQTRNTVITRQ